MSSVLEESEEKNSQIQAETLKRSVASLCRTYEGQTFHFHLNFDAVRLPEAAVPKHTCLSFYSVAVVCVISHGQSSFFFIIIFCHVVAPGATTC